MSRPYSTIAADPGKYQSAAEEFRREIQQQAPSGCCSIARLGWCEVWAAEMAVWMQRAVIVENVLARREGEILCVPVSLAESPKKRVQRSWQLSLRLNQLWLV